MTVHFGYTGIDPDELDDGPILETVLVEPQEPGSSPVIIQLTERDIVRDEAPRKIALNDPEALARLDSLTSQAKQILQQVESSVWDLGNVLAPIRNERLFLARGYKSFKAFCQAELPFDDRLARLYIDFATFFSRQEFLELRYARARALITYLRATPEDDSYRDLKGHALRHGRARGKLLEMATVAEIEEAARGEAGKLAPETVIPDGIASIVENLQRALGDASRVGLSQSPKAGDQPAEIAIDLKRVRVSELRAVALKLLEFAEQLNPS